MPKLKTSFTCEVCGQPITCPHFRIEWGHTSQPAPCDCSKFDFIQVCHHDCSYGIRTIPAYPATFGDIIFDQPSPSLEDVCNKLDELAQRNPILSEKIETIKNTIFE